MTKTQNGTQTDFIMSPTVDVCFAGLMENPVVRKGFCAAVMRIPPDLIGETMLLPTHLRRENAQDKLGILDVVVKLKDGTTRSVIVPCISEMMRAVSFIMIRWRFRFWNSGSCRRKCGQGRTLWIGCVS